MRNKTIAIALMLALAVPAALLASGEEEAAMAEDAHLEITWLGDSPDESWWIGQLEEMFNVTITLDGTARFDGERERIIVAAGEFPDTGAPCCLNTLKLYEDQVIRSLPEEMLRTHAPDYSRAMDERYPAIWTIYRAADMEGEQMAMGAIAQGSMASVFHLFTRKDWLDALGVELPDYDETKTFLARGIHYYENDALTLDWLENLLVAYRDGDPDGNGKNDTIPYGAYTQGARPFGSWPWGAIQGALGVPTTNLDRNHYVDGELYIAHVSPRFREFTELVARWWDMGLIDSEFFTIDRGASWEKAATGAFGVYNSNYNYVGRVPSRPPDNLISDEDVANGVELVMFAPIGPRGEQFAGMYGTSYVRGQVQVMNKNLSDAKTARVMEIVNTKYRLNDGTNEGIDLWIQWEYNHGEEGVHWEWAGEPYNSQTRRIPADERPADAPGRGGFPTNYPNYSPVESFAFTYPPQQTDWILNHLFGDRVRGQTFATEYFDIFNETDFREMSGRRGEALQTMAAEFFAKAVTGEIDIDAEWDNYVANWMAAGGNELMAEIAKMPRWSDFF